MNEKRQSTSLLREGVLQGALLVILLVPIFPGVFLHGERTVPGSFLYESYPWKAYTPPTLPAQNRMYKEVVILTDIWYTLSNQALAQGKWPLWNPCQFTGTPLFADYQSAVCYPLRLLFLAFSDVHVSMTLFVLAKIWICGMVAYFCARALAIHPPWARFFSVAYAFGGFTLTWAYFPPPDSLTWLPLLFLGAEWLIAHRYRRGIAATFVGAVLTLLGGHPQTAFAACFALGLYFALRLAAEMKRGVRAVCAPILAMAFGWAIALAVCAVQILPFFEFIENGATAMNLLVTEGATSQSYTPASLLSLWCARLFGTEYEGTFWGALNHNYLGMLYVGVPVWVGAFLLLSRVALPGVWKSRVLSAVATCLACLLFASGAPGFSALSALPPFASVRPAYFFAFAAFALPLLAAIGLQQAFSSARYAKRFLAAVACSALVIAILTAGVWWCGLTQAGDPGAPMPQAYVARQVAWAAALFFVSLLVLAAGVRRMRLAWQSAALTAILAIDLIVAQQGLLSTTPPQWLYIDTPLTRYVQQLEPPPRVKAEGVWGPPLAVYGIEQLYGYDAIHPARFCRFHEAFIHDGWGAIEPLLAIPYYLFDESAAGAIAQSSGLEKDRTLDHVVIARNTNALPRARLVGHLECCASTEEMFARMHAPDFDGARVALTDVPVATELPPDPPLADLDPGTARITDAQSDRVVVQAQASARCVLVLADAYYPGWQAEVDGASAELFPVYHLFRGVIVPPGEHTVTFTYRPAPFRLGLAISSATLLVCAMAGLIVLFAPRRRTPRAG